MAEAVTYWRLSPHGRICDRRSAVDERLFTRNAEDT